jgi:hypothetical protein
VPRQSIRFLRPIAAACPKRLPSCKPPTTPCVKKSNVQMVRLRGSRAMRGCWRGRAGPPLTKPSGDGSGNSAVVGSRAFRPEVLRPRLSVGLPSRGSCRVCRAKADQPDTHTSCVGDSAMRMPGYITYCFERIYSRGQARGGASRPAICCLIPTATCCGTLA